LRQRLRELAGERKRFGSPRLHIMLRREGLVVNHKRTERIYHGRPGVEEKAAEERGCWPEGGDAFTPAAE